MSEKILTTHFMMPLVGHEFPCLSFSIHGLFPEFCTHIQYLRCKLVKLLVFGLALKLQ